MQHRRTATRPATRAAPCAPAIVTWGISGDQRGLNISPTKVANPGERPRRGGGSPMKGSGGLVSEPLVSASTGGLQAALFHQQVSKMRKLIAGTTSFQAARARRLWRVAIAAARFGCRLRRAARLGVKLTHAEREHLYRCYWEHSQKAGGLFHIDSIGKLLQEFNQPQPPTTVEELLQHVQYNVSETQTRPISFGQAVQMLLQLKRAHRVQTRVSDEAELFHQLATAQHTAGTTAEVPVVMGGAGGGHDDRGQTGSASLRNHNTARVDASSVSGILKAFDLRVVPPEEFVAQPAGAVGASLPSPSSGGAPIHRHAVGAVAPTDAGTLLTFDEFQTFLKQSSSPTNNSASMDASTLRRHGQPPALNGVDFSGRFQPWEASSAENSPIAGAAHRSPTQPVSSMAPMHGELGGHPVNQQLSVNMVGGGRHDSTIGEDASFGIGGPASHAGAMHSAGARGSGGARLDDVEAAAEIDMLVAEGFSQELVDVKQKLRATNRRILSWHHTTHSDQRFRAMEVEAERVSGGGNWVLKQRPMSHSKHRHPPPTEQLQLVRTHVVRDHVPVGAKQGPTTKADTPTPSRRVSPSIVAAAVSPTRKGTSHVDVPAVNDHGTTPLRQHGAHGSTTHRHPPSGKTEAKGGKRPLSAQPIVHSGQVMPTNLLGVARGTHETHAPTIWVAASDAATRDATFSHPTEDKSHLSTAAPTLPPRPASATGQWHPKEQRASPARPASASAVRRRLDRCLKPTPLEQLAATPSFRLTEGQRVSMETWYVQQYARLTPAVDQPDGAYRLETATSAIARSTLHTLSCSNVERINDTRAADYHGTSPMDAYMDTLRYGGTTSHGPLGAAPSAQLGSGDRNPSSAMGVAFGGHQRPLSAPMTSAGGRGAGPQWLQGSSFEVAMKQRPPVHVQPPPSGFLTSD